ncbi:ABC1 kinase family protein [Paenibacillus thalictri]|uniref:AarF/ABC1/UbiB kinase family protein n=1 Tax=Paenibacillus thalictri TaxID=2527873 RepID=A0A4Q9DU50_9BACL|nr:AarF/ABC1/UbiB kinase family protein [Paenibacillus thalictri]TBL78928.1 AarF/ABC1/UbiB kinase family protein [Paenibacillus thalictri]
MSAGKRIRQLQRYRTIAAAFARNGLGYVSGEIGLTEKLQFFRSDERRSDQTKSIGERIRLLLEELGPTFVKLGQLASTRPDLIPGAILAELERLQDNVPAFSYREASDIIEQELGETIESLFLQFDEIPLAAASIGQVYRAVLKDGTPVAVKVQRPHIRMVIETDLDILNDWARLAENGLEWASNYRLRDIVDELGKALRAELDYTTEARNAEKFADQCKTWRNVRVPKVHWDYCTSKVLTMDFVEGIKLSDHEQLDRTGLDRKLLAEQFAKTILNQVLVEGFFHGDPHPGNVLALTDGSLVLLDFGMVGRLTPGMKKHFASFVIALQKKSSKGIIRAISNMGIVPDETDIELLYADVEEMRETYYKVPLHQVSIGQAIRDLFALALRHRIRMPSELTLLGKTLLTMEGVVSALDPTFSVFDVAEPFGRKLLLERFSPLEMVKMWMEDLPDYVDLLKEIPLGLKQLSSVMRKGQFRIEVSVPQLDELMKKMDRITNRLSLSIVLLSLSIMMVGLIIGSAISHSQSMLWRIPVIEIGFIAAILMFLWLLYLIVRSGRF